MFIVPNPLKSSSEPLPRCLQNAALSDESPQRGVGQGWCPVLFNHSLVSAAVPAGNQPRVCCPQEQGALCPGGDSDPEDTGFCRFSPAALRGSALQTLNAVVRLGLALIQDGEISPEIVQKPQRPRVKKMFWLKSENKGNKEINCCLRNN